MLTRLGKAAGLLDAHHSAQRPQQRGIMVQPLAKLPWLICTGCGGHNPPDKSFCGDCKAAKNEPSRWLDVLPRKAESKGKGKGKGKADSVTKGNGKGKDPSVRKPQPRQFGDYLGAANRAAASQPAGQGAPRVGASKSSTEKQQAAKITLLIHQLEEAKKAVGGPAMASEDVPVEEEAVDDWRCGVCDKSHWNHKKTSCSICATSRTATSAPAAAPGRSPAEVATTRAELLASRDALATFATTVSPATLALAAKEIEDKLLRLDAPSAPAAPLDAYGRLEQARVAQATAQTFLDKVIAKAKELDDRRIALEKDLDAVAQAVTYADRELNLATAALTAAKEALCLDADAQLDADERMHSAIVQEVMQHVTQLITKELTQNLEGMDKESLLHSMLTKLAGYASKISGYAAPPQAAEPPRGAPAPAAPAAPSVAPPHGARGACDASFDELMSRLPQRVPKIAAVETPAAYDRRQQDAVRLRKVARAADLDTRREDGEQDPRTLLGDAAP